MSVQFDLSRSRWVVRWYEGGHSDRNASTTSQQLADSTPTAGAPLPKPATRRPLAPPRSWRSFARA